MDKIYFRIAYFYRDLIRPIAKLISRIIFHRYSRFDIFFNRHIRRCGKQAGGVVVAQTIRRIVCFPTCYELIIEQNLIVIKISHYI